MINFERINTDSLLFTRKSSNLHATDYNIAADTIALLENQNQNFIENINKLELKNIQLQFEVDRHNDEIENLYRSLEACINSLNEVSLLLFLMIYFRLLY